MSVKNQYIISRLVTKRGLFNVPPSAVLPPFLRPVDGSTLTFFSFAFCFAPNLRPIIAAEEAISNLNETPSHSRARLLGLAPPRPPPCPPARHPATPLSPTIDRIHRAVRLRVSSGDANGSSSPETIVLRPASRTPTRNSPPSCQNSQPSLNFGCCTQFNLPAVRLRPGELALFL